MAVDVFNIRELGMFFDRSRESGAKDPSQRANFE
jgi:hypothetical protein